MTRDGRCTSVLSWRGHLFAGFKRVLGAVTVLRGLGLVGILADIHAPVALMIPSVALTLAFPLGYLGISRGAIIAPPAFIAGAVTAPVKRVAERTAQLTWETR